MDVKGFRVFYCIAIPLLRCYMCSLDVFTSPSIKRAKIFLQCSSEGFFLLMIALVVFNADTQPCTVSAPAHLDS